MDRRLHFEAYTAEQLRDIAVLHMKSLQSGPFSVEAASEGLLMQMAKGVAKGGKSNARGMKNAVDALHTSC